MQTYYIKRFTSSNRFHKEKQIYQSAYPYKAELIRAEDNTLTLSFLDGVPYLDVVPLTKEIIIALAEAISAFHNLFSERDKVWCHWDNQPRNILWSEKQQKIYLLDFEDCHLAYPETDLAHLLLFWAATMTQRQYRENVELFLSVYDLSVPLTPDIWEKSIKNSIIRFDLRRKKYHKCEQLVNPDTNANRRFLRQFFSKCCSSDGPVIR